MNTVRLAVVGYVGAGGMLAAGGQVWPSMPFCLVALVVTGELLVRALVGGAPGPVPPGRSAPGLPAARAGFAVVAGLVTLPLVALVLHVLDMPVRRVPLGLGVAAVTTLAAAGALLRARFATPASRPEAASWPEAAARPGERVEPDQLAESKRPGGLPAQRSGGSGPGAVSGGTGRGAEPVAEAGAISAGAIPAEVGTISAGAISAGAGRAGAISAGSVRIGVAVVVPVALAVVIGGVAARAYLDAPRPEQPGYLSVALNGWAAGIDAPVTVPMRGLAVPVRVTSAGFATVTTMLRLWVDGRIVAAKPVTVAADTVRSLTVHVPALPPDGCLRAVKISVGKMSAGFYARGPVADRAAARRPGARVPVTGAGAGPGAAVTGAGAAITGPGVSERGAVGPGIAGRSAGSAPVQGGTTC
jgi:hypothetical protein